MTVEPYDRPRVAGINLYPLKSARGIAVPAAGVEPDGLAGDRRWAAVDELGRWVSVVAHPALLTIVAVPTAGGGLTLTAPGAAPLTVPATAGAAADSWLSGVLGTPVRLVPIAGARRYPPPGPDGAPTPGGAIDGPLLLTSASSLRQLDEWIAAVAAERGEPAPAPLEMARFRPSVVVDAEPPFAEDGWRRVRIGDIEYRLLERCDRCAVTLLDPRTARSGKEPLRTLARYRREAGKVWFGVRLTPLTSGEIRVGDPVTVEPVDAEPVDAEPIDTGPGR